MRLPDPRLWAPLALAIAALTAREATRRPPQPAPVLGHAVALPLPRGTAAPRAELEYALDLSQSSIHFLLERDGEQRLFTCSVAEGRLVLSPDPTRSRLRLRLALSSLRADPDQGDAHGDDLWDPLGLQRHADLVYDATLTSAATTPVACLSRLLWQGTLQFGSRVVRQPMELWQTALPGRALRLQGHGTVAGDTYGITPRGLFAFLHDRHAVTLGLDLAWRRAADR